MRVKIIDPIFPLSTQADGVPAEDVELDIFRRQLEDIGSRGSNATILAGIELIEKVHLTRFNTIDIQATIHINADKVALALNSLVTGVFCLGQTTPK